MILNKGPNSRRFKIANKFKKRQLKHLAAAKRASDSMVKHLSKVHPNFMNRASRMLKRKNAKKVDSE